MSKKAESHHLKDYQFKSKGVGVKNSTPPLSVKVDAETKAYVDSRPNKSQWLREAIAEKIERELGQEP